MVSPTPAPQGIPITAEAAEQVVPQIWGIHGQITNTWELQPAFYSPYFKVGPHSLWPGANGRETTDITAYLGLRPWQGAEIWANPTMDQGFGLSDTFGVAGYPSGEAYKLGRTTPYFKLDRAFFRQTINLGGETEKVEPDANVLGGAQTSNRLVMTIGKFSVVDIFDTNKYAHDPRSDFLNWTIVDLGAFDYAADAWGFTYGAAAEWQQDWWTARVGLFDLSATPNNIYLSTRGFSQGQFCAELEDRHTLWDQPGKFKVLFFLTGGKLATYDNALDWGEKTGLTPDVEAVRSYRHKYGIGFNLEQQLVPDLGMFLRGGWCQGGVEEVDFTDVDVSVSYGLSLKGSHWCRPDDNVGLAMVVNQISNPGREYFGAGGLGGIIGDGELTHAAPELIFETYYNIAVVSFPSPLTLVHAGTGNGTLNFTVDYQLIIDPAYNVDRGPVSVFGLRAHAEF
jgi:high affinity Mn2+ porin